MNVLFTCTSVENFENLIIENKKYTVQFQTTNIHIFLVAAQAAPTPAAPAHADQTTLVHNEQEAFALEPLDVTTTHGKNKLVKLFNHFLSVLTDKRECCKSS